MRLTATMALIAAAVTGCSTQGSPAAPGAHTPVEHTTREVRTTLAHPFLAWARENYPGTSWLPAVRAAHDQAGQLWIDTTLPPGNTSRVAACAIAVAGTAWVLGEGGVFRGVRVAAATGERLVLSESLGAPPAGC